MNFTSAYIVLAYRRTAVLLYNYYPYDFFTWHRNLPAFLSDFTFSMKINTVLGKVSEWNTLHTHTKLILANRKQKIHPIFFIRLLVTVGELQGCHVLGGSKCTW